ncbi:putative transcription factor [Senna tora]|uniref:Putative transcription factor n=1 Tax=Senna tora TaxID=362788 RepID=A0A834SMW7_9FABA|nr:putative transcription factor [Senna tora]
MNSSSLGGGFLSGPDGGTLDLESPFHRGQHNQLGLSSVTNQHHLNMMSGLENDHSVRLIDVKGSNASFNFGRGKAVAHANPTNSTDLSEEDEPSHAEDGNCENHDGRKSGKGSPWQRMKWTDNVVRLLISVVACVGDDGTVEGIDGHKRKAGVLQKKGKWKTVSKIMIRKGCRVSPQQCEDKFNDLNKRFKKLNDLLGRGTSCRVVENPAIMDSMPNLSAKTKDVVRKILSSKHLFFKEMCAYHNGQIIPFCSDLDLQGYSLQQGRETDSRDNNGSEEDPEEDNASEDDELDNEGNRTAYGDGERMEEFSHRKRLNDEDGHGCPQSVGLESFQAEMSRIFQDPRKSMWERREWIQIQKVQLLEQRLSYQVQSLELEKQRFKWQRYCSKKDRELERLKLENERMNLENERRILQLKQRELDLDFRRSEMSVDPASLPTDRLHRREHIDLGRQL